MIDVHWKFFPSLLGPEMVGACRAGVATVELHTSGGTIESFPCNANRAGQILVEHDERVLVRLVDANGATVAESPPETVDTFREVVARFYEDAGYALAHWHVFTRDPGTANPMRCFGVEAPLSLTVTQNGQRYFDQAFPCPDDGRFSFVTRSALLEGAYVFTFTGLDGANSIPVVIGRNNAMTVVDVATP